MANTHGFEVVVEATAEVLRKALRGAWKSAECPEEPGELGRIPEYMDIPAGTTFGGYTIVDGQVQIPQDELDAAMWPAVDGAELKLGLKLQVEIECPPVPSAGFFDMTADVRARVPIGTEPGGQDVFLKLQSLTRANVVATLTSGDPLAAKLGTLLAEYMHKAYEGPDPMSPCPQDPSAPQIPHTITKNDVDWPIPFGNIRVDVYAELYDDLADPTHSIAVTRPTPAMVDISIPIYLRIHNIRKTGTAQYLGIKGPMGVDSRVIITATLDSPPGEYTARLGSATAAAGTITAHPGTEGQNYEASKAALAAVSDLDATLSAAIAEQGTAMAHTIGDRTVPVPTVGEIESTIGDLFFQNLQGRQQISVWTPTSVPEADFNVNDVTVKSFADMLVIALNAQAGDVGAMTNFVPGGRDFAIALDAGRVNATIATSRTEKGLDDASLPRRFHESGKDVDLHTLDVFLAPGAIRMTGSVTVIDAIAGSIDVDADFTTNVGLKWKDNADGTQMMVPELLGDPDVDPEESVAYWIITIILAVLSFGAGSLLIILVAFIVQAIVEGIASSIGGDMLRDHITGEVLSFSGWPSRLGRIGRVRTRFLDPISIDDGGIVMAGTLEVISSCESVPVLAANSGGAYAVQAASPLALMAQHTGPFASYRWTTGDGAAAVNTRDVIHTYEASGFYVAKHTLTVDEAGGATSRHFALVKVGNVPPTADAGADITVAEGEVVTLVGHFEDVEYGDTHETSWTFGDDQPPAAGTVVETHVPPRAAGSSTVKHAWCDNGEYEVLFRVRDQNGGMSTGTRRVSVRNVSPTVDAGPAMFAYSCSVITLTGRFTDPGWCDTHTGSWAFGDCTPAQMAIVHETHAPPAGTGVAIASHVYHRCGTYQAVCTVRDDDGAEGSAATVVRVVELENPGFEQGFRRRTGGEVGNGWEPYASVIPPPYAAGAGGAFADLGAVAVFAAEEFVVHSGERSQSVRGEAPYRAGIRQRIGANSGWDYQVSAWYAIAEQCGAVARLGVDPDGGTDPDSPAIVWAAGEERRAWSTLAVRVGAAGQAITIFIEGIGAPAGPHVPAGGTVWVDDVALVPIQPFCPEQPAAPPREPPTERCLAFDDVQQDEVPPTYQHASYTLRSLEGRAMRIVAGGPPPGARKLGFGRAVLIDLPFPADRVRARVHSAVRTPLEIAATDAGGAVLGVAASDPANPAVQTLVLRKPGIVRVQLTCKGREATLIELCARRADQEAPVSDDQRPAKSAPATLDQARKVLAAQRDALAARYGAEGLGIGRAGPGSGGYAIVVYLASSRDLPEQTVAIDGVPVRFEVTGKFRAL